MFHISSSWFMKQHAGFILTNILLKSTHLKQKKGSISQSSCCDSFRDNTRPTLHIKFGLRYIRKTTKGKLVNCGPADQIRPPACCMTREIRIVYMVLNGWKKSKNGISRDWKWHKIRFQCPWIVLLDHSHTSISAGQSWPAVTVWPAKPHRNKCVTYYLAL